MEVATTRVPTARLPMRQLAVLALIGILLVAALAVYVGSQKVTVKEAGGTETPLLAGASAGAVR